MILILDRNKIREIKKLIDEKCQVKYYKKPHWKQKRQLCLWLYIKDKDLCFWKTVDYKEGENIDLNEEKDNFAYDIEIEGSHWLKDYGRH